MHCARREVLSWLEALGATEAAEDHEVTLPALPPTHHLAAASNGTGSGSPPQQQLLDGCGCFVCVCVCERGGGAVRAQGLHGCALAPMVGMLRSACPDAPPTNTRRAQRLHELAGGQGRAAGWGQRCWSPCRTQA
jgi:hypothetical protein